MKRLLLVAALAVACVGLSAGTSFAQGCGYGGYGGGYRAGYGGGYYGGGYGRVSTGYRGYGGYSGYGGGYNHYHYAPQPVYRNYYAPPVYGRGGVGIYFGF